MRYLFCINAGRSGSNYLAELLGTAEGVAAFHEAEPNMSGEPLRSLEHAPLADSYRARAVKLEGIARLLAERPWARMYAETNHMFIKTFYDVVCDALPVEVIHLRRDAARVLKSMIELGWFSPRNEVWPAWLSSPNAVTAVAKPLGPDDELDQYDRCIAYLHDIEARADAFRRQRPEVAVHEIDLEDIVEATGAHALFRRLGLEPTERTAAVVGRVINRREAVKERIANPADLDECRRRIADYAARAAAAGLGLPPLRAREA